MTAPLTVPRASTRHVVVDCETTGLSHSNDRIIQLALVELINHLPSGRQQMYRFDPGDVSMNPFAQRIHGIAIESLRSEPSFAQCADMIVNFIGMAQMIAHNASFDAGFLDAELARSGHAPPARRRWTCTMKMSREIWEGEPAKLDAVCIRLGIITTKRQRHDALEDCLITAQAFRMMQTMIEPSKSRPRRATVTAQPMVQGAVIPVIASPRPVLQPTHAAPISPARINSPLFMDDGGFDDWRKPSLSKADASDTTGHAVLYWVVGIVVLAFILTAFLSLAGR